ncbi:hypothetical protein NCM_05439 [Burkholderia pseudomallei]
MTRPVHPLGFAEAIACCGTAAARANGVPLTFARARDADLLRLTFSLLWNHREETVL